MKKQLELKHIAPYIQHGLTCNLMGKFDAKKDTPLIFKVTGIDQRFVEIGNEGNYYEIESEDFKPLLRPMSDLFENIVHNGEDVWIQRMLNDLGYSDYNGIFYNSQYQEHPHLDFKENLGEVPYDAIQLLFKYHFDVFGLIEKGLAEPIKNK